MVLEDTKKLLGIASDYDAFDIDVSTHVNAALQVLKQLGVNIKSMLDLGSDKNWNEVIDPEGLDMSLIKAYVYFKVRLGFDPPQSSSVLESIRSLMQEYEWRINTELEVNNSISENSQRDGSKGDDSSEDFWYYDELEGVDWGDESKE